MIAFAVVLLASGVARSQADLRLTDDVTIGSTTPTRPLTIRFIAQNNGPGVATGVVASTPATLPFPAGQVTVTASGCVVAQVQAATIEWQIGAMAVGEARACSVTVTASSTATPQFADLALRISGNESDPVTSNNLAGAILVVSPVDVVSDVAISAAIMPLGLVRSDGSSRLRVTLSNQGPDTARTASRLDLLASGASPHLEFFPVPEDPCSSAILNEPGVEEVLVSTVAALSPMASVTCIVGIAKKPEASVPNVTLEFAALVTGFGAFDPEPTNNRFGLGVGIFVAPVPAFDSRTTLVTVLFVAAMAWRRYSRRGRSAR